MDQYKPDLEDQINYNVTHYRMEMAHLKDLYTTYSSTLATPDFYFINNDKTGAPNFIRDHPNGEVVGSYNEIIVLGHTHTHIYGHWIHDVLAPLTLLPKEIVQRAHLLCIDSFIFETLEPFGIKMEQVVVLRNISI